MRRFQPTPQKKLLGMAILFVALPLFLLWYWVFFLNHKPGADTMVILVAVALLSVYFYIKNRPMVNAFVFGKKPEDEMAEQLSEESPEDSEGFEDSEDSEFEDEEFQGDEQEAKK